MRVGLADGLVVNHARLAGVEIQDDDSVLIPAAPERKQAPIGAESEATITWNNTY